MTTKTKQITMFEIDKPTLYKGLGEDHIKDSSGGIINLRQELKDAIPSTTYLTHSIHNVYPAKFIPQVIAYVLKEDAESGM